MTLEARWQMATRGVITDRGGRGSRGDHKGGTSRCNVRDERQSRLRWQQAVARLTVVSYVFRRVDARPAHGSERALCDQRRDM